MSPSDYQDKVGNVPTLAAKIIRTGGLVAIPTETFYGLAAESANEISIHRIFQLKERQKNKPILLLINQGIDLTKLVAEITSEAEDLMKNHWPGPLTLVFRAGPEVLPVLTGGSGKIGIRYSSHPMVDRIINLVGSPITGTSANMGGKSPCISPNEVYIQLGKKLDYILDGGETPGGPGSTVVDVTARSPRVLRQGIIHI